MSDGVSTGSTDTDATVTITVNGDEVAARPGELLIDACERSGTYIPRFCHQWECAGCASWTWTPAGDRRCSRHA